MSDPVEDLERDTGLAAERTEIAWGRSALAIATCAAAVLRRAPTSSRIVNVVVAATLLAMLGAVAVLLARRRTASPSLAPIDRVRLRLRDAALLSSLVGVMCLVVVVARAG